MNDLFHGSLVRLTAEEPALLASSFSRWSRNTTYHRLLDTDPQTLYSSKSVEKEMEKDFEKLAQGGLPEGFFFNIRAVPEDRLIGFVGLWNLSWPHGDCMVGIGLGEPEYWGKGYGTEAMRLVLRYAFVELNLHRVTLFVFDYNPRAIRSYQKAGFQFEGRLKGLIQREGQRHDVTCMGILRDEWLSAQQRVVQDE